MQQYRKNLGKVSLTAEGVWNRDKNYDILSIVYDEHTQHGFISKKDVPSGVDLYNSEFWMPLNVSGFVDNNVIILSKKTSDYNIQSYTLEEAVKSIASVGRRPGAILGFYNLNNDRLDIGGRWELWQYNAVDISNWENLSSWQNIYYNFNKFVGWYKDENILKQYNPFPEIGCYAFVGTKLNEATIYRCENKYIWTDTTQHSWDYVKVIVDGNVTVGENGNWFNNGVDTNIPASIKGENGKTPVFRNNNNVIEVSYDNVEWNPISDEIAAWFRWQSEGGQQANLAGKIQITRDGVTWTDLSGEFVNNLHISRYIGTDESLPTSGIAEGTIYAKGPYYEDTDTNHDYPAYRIWVYAWKGNTLAWVDHGQFTSIAAGIVQETGDSEVAVMSQKAVTSKLSELAQKENLINRNILDSISTNYFGMQVDVDGYYVGNLGETKFNGGIIGSIIDISDFEVLLVQGTVTGQNLSAYAFFNDNLDVNDLSSTFVPANIISYGGKVGSFANHEINEVVIVPNGAKYAYIYGDKLNINVAENAKVTEYKNKKIMFIGDSFSAFGAGGDTIMMWQYLQRIWKANVVTPNYNDLPPTASPAKGGIKLIPPINEPSTLNEKSIWYKCTNGVCTGWNADVIFLLGGANDGGMTLGSINDAAYVANADDIKEDNNITDVRPDVVTYYSALKGCVLMLKAYNPMAEVILWSYSNNLSEDLTTAQLEVANYYGIKFIPVYYEFPKNNMFIADGTHVNSNGGLIQAKCIASYLGL